MAIHQFKRNPLFIAIILFVIIEASAGAQEIAQISRTKEFIVMGYEGILFELRSGEGAYLNTLNELLGTKTDQGAQTIEQVRSFSKAYPNIMDFADQVITLQQTKEAGQSETSVEPKILLPTGPTIYSGDRLENALNHLTRGMKITVMSKRRTQFTGDFEDYSVHRLWIKGSSRMSFTINDILAIEAPDL